MWRNCPLKVLGHRFDSNQTLDDQSSELAPSPKRTDHQMIEYIIGHMTGIYLYKP